MLWPTVLPLASLLAMLVISPALVLAQSDATAISSSTSSLQDSPAAPSSSRYRKLDPDALITVPPSAQIADTVSRRGFLAELKAVGGGKALSWKPQELADSDTMAFQADAAEIRREVWSLEFTFKPLRLIEVSTQGPSGSAETRKVWYLMYRVRDLGGHLQPVREESGLYKIQKVDALETAVRFRPTFELYSHEFKKCYLDEHAPAVVEAVRQREDPNRDLLSNRQMALQKFGKGTEAWGVAVWNYQREVDPRIDFFSIYVRGLTNAYAEQSMGEKTRLLPKTLQINFWRPGDALDLQEDEFRYGLPVDDAAKYGLDKARPHRWVFLQGCTSGR